ncbi:hypothetical protein CDCA_CDCA20G4803 [Cyanidium caldarium]|uniref:CSN8/PSMD8/EIF3K domain-containing protein n=1 Tax=Cyanidium caldarium TaxID=2771 RepID=A0AAV9J349_CYACA|nr:hypothetical protein CDCA_CDCA20G4803 [Cyanidium caldarium]
MASDSEIADLLHSRRYDPAILSTLEAYMERQVRGGADAYDAEANAAVLKLYQLEPDRLQGRTVVLILAKAIMALPSIDLLSCVYLLAPAQAAEASTAASYIGDDGPIRGVLALAERLEAGHFAQFWEELERERADGTALGKLLAEVVDFEQCVRRFMVGALGRTWSRMSPSVLKALTRDDACPHGWRMVTDADEQTVLETPVGSVLSQQPRAAGERLSFERLAPVLCRVGRESARARPRRR